MRKDLSIFFTTALMLSAIHCVKAADEKAACTYLVPSKVKLGIYERIRYEFQQNVADLNDDAKDNRGYFRFKTSPSLQYDFTKDTDLYARLTNENKAYTYWAGASSSAGKSASKKGYHYDINETVFDNLYFDWRNLFGVPLDVRVGRQDLENYGEGFLIKDGTPLDGTRTNYFNAVKAGWRINDKNTLEFLAIKDPRTDDILPIINRLDGEQQLNSTDEYGFALYHKTDSFKGLHWENYYMYKHEDGRRTGANMTRSETKLNTIGSFAKYSLDPWTLRGQLAGQFGDYGTIDREGLGGYAFVDRDFKKAPWSPQASLGYVYLSGNKNGGPKNKAWDPLWSRDTWYSVLFASYLASETETSYWTNLRMLRSSLTFKPTEKLKASLWYNYLWADELVPPTRTLFSGEHKNRGHLPQFRLDYTIDKNISTYLLAEYFIPGDFYVKSADNAIFLRWELSYKY